MKQIAIRVDGNEIIASGHVMRCLSIAQQCREMGAEVVFLLADTSPCTLIQGKGFETEVLKTTWDDLDQETELLCEWLRNHPPDLLLVDSYYVTEAYLSTLSRQVLVAYIDDLYRFAYPVHTLINYAAFVDREKYHQLYQVSETPAPSLLLGSDYIPLREEFAHRSCFVEREVSRVLVTTGGTDQLDVAGNLLQWVDRNPQLSKLEYHVIVGYFNQNRQRLYDLAGNNPHIILHENVTDMSQWMRFCDIAVSAAGTTIYELCACGIPSICLEIAHNQRGAAEWEASDIMFYAGNAAQDMDGCMEKCQKSLLEYVENFGLRQNRSRRMQSLVDGHGAERIASHLVNGRGL